MTVIPEPESAELKPAPVRRVLGGNTATGILKLIALVFMMIDHSGKMVCPGIPEMRYLGRIAFPVYVWCMIVGFEYTRSVPKYLGRILLVGLGSQPLYMVALNHKWYEPNIFLTLFLGLCALGGIGEKKFGSQFWAPVLAILLSGILKVDYGWKGILFMLLLYPVRYLRSGIAAVMIAYFLFWGCFYSLTPSLFGWTIPYNDMFEPLQGIMKALNRSEAYGLLSLPLILIPFRKDWKMPHWLSYALYPAHLVLLWIMETLK